MSGWFSNVTYELGSYNRSATKRNPYMMSEHAKKMIESSSIIPPHSLHSRYSSSGQAEPHGSHGLNCIGTLARRAATSFPRNLPGPAKQAGSGEPERVDPLRYCRKKGSLHPILLILRKTGNGPLVAQKSAACAAHRMVGLANPVGHAVYVKRPGPWILSALQAF